MAQAGLELVVILMTQPSKHQDYRHVPPCLGLRDRFFVFTASTKEPSLGLRDEEDKQDTLTVLLSQLLQGKSTTPKGLWFSSSACKDETGSERAPPKPQ